MGLNSNSFVYNRIKKHTSNDTFDNTHEGFKLFTINASRLSFIPILIIDRYLKLFLL